MTSSCTRHCPHHRLLFICPPICVLISYACVLAADLKTCHCTQELNVMDTTAITLCKENNIPVARIPRPTSPHFLLPPCTVIPSPRVQLFRPPEAAETVADNADQRFHHARFRVVPP